jgi:branched-chain amino acid transport system permease protein
LTLITLSLQGEKKYIHYFLIAAAIAFFLCLPEVLSIYGVTLLTGIFIYSIFSMSLNLLIGYLGYPSLGHATFFGVGGYALALLILKGGFQNFFFCIVVTLIVAAILSFLLGLIAITVSGIYFMMITLAIGQVFWALVWSWKSLTGGDDGLPGISRPILAAFGHRWSLSNEITFYYLIFIVLILCLLLTYLIVKSPFGRALLGIRSNEMRMRALGYNTWRYKYFCYVIAGIFGSLAGALKVYQDCFISASSASIVQSGLVLLTVIIGGSRIFLGPVVGAFIIQIISNIVSSYTEYWLTIMGSALILSVMFFPEGITGYVVGRIKSKGHDN